MARSDTSQSLSPEHVRKELRMMLLSSIFTINLFVMLVPAQIRAILSDWLVVVCAGAVVAVSVAILYRQKFKGLYGRTYGVMAIGLLLWFSAELIATYENYWVTSTLNPARGLIASVSTLMQPSIADAIWLVGYGFFAYFLFRIMVHFSRSINARVLIIIAVATAITAFILAQSISHFYALHGVSSPFSATDSANSDIAKSISLFLHIEYPVLDLMLIIPALVVLSGVKDGKLTSTPWLLLSAAVFILAISDIGSIYSSVLNIGEEVQWIWKMFATAAYLCIATSLFWYNRFFIYDAKRATKVWQEKNR